jgi:hypothetical protein
MRWSTISFVVQWVASVSPLAVAITAGDAYASVSIAVTWEGLLRESTAAAVVTPIESHSVWENGRIYSYARARVDRRVAGDLGPGSEVWVRTMGGIVGKIGQLVEGEAVLAPGQPSLVFLRAAPMGVMEVATRGQGQFPIVAGDANGPARVIRNHAVGALVAPQAVASSAVTRLAADVVHGRPVDEVTNEIVADWTRMHARP